MAEAGRIAPPLRLCRGCRQFARLAEQSCPFCGADLDALDAEHEERLAELHQAADAAREALARIAAR